MLSVNQRLTAGLMPNFYRPRRRYPEPRISGLHTVWQFLFRDWLYFSFFRRDCQARCPKTDYHKVLHKIKAEKTRARRTLVTASVKPSNIGTSFEIDHILVFPDEIVKRASPRHPIGICSGKNIRNCAKAEDIQARTSRSGDKKKASARSRGLNSDNAT